MQLESCYYTEPSTHSGLQRLIVEFSFKRVISHLRYFCVFQRIFIQWQCLWKKCFCHCFSIAIGMATAIEDAKPCPLLWRAATLITDCERIVRIWFRQLAFAQKLRFTLKKEPCTLYRNYRTGFGIFCSCLTFLPFISKSFFYLKKNYPESGWSEMCCRQNAYKVSSSGISDLFQNSCAEMES